MKKYIVSKFWFQCVYIFCHTLLSCRSAVPLQDIQIDALLMRACDPVIQAYCHVSRHGKPPLGRAVVGHGHLNKTKFIIYSTLKIIFILIRNTMM